LSLYEQQEKEKQLEGKFAQLKAKYQVSEHPDRSVQEYPIPLLSLQAITSVRRKYTLQI
jgi:hypothetical protein